MENKEIVIITGCSRGIGYETSLLLAKKNYKVYAFIRSYKTANSILKKKNNNLILIEIDITKFEKVRKEIEKIIQIEGKIDILINNAAKICFGAIEEVSINQIQGQFEINFLASINLVHSVLPIMRKQKKGKIIFIGSTSGVKSHGMYGIYSSSKFAIESMAYALAVNTAKWNIKVALVEVSATTTEIATLSLTRGDRFKNKSNPYLEYTDQNLKLLKKILQEGDSPQTIAKGIYNALQDDCKSFRYFATKKAKTEFKNVLVDPQSSHLNLEKSINS